MIVIVCQGYARAGLSCNFVGSYLEWYRPNDPADTPLACWTRDIKRAKKFATMADAMAEWRRERTVDPHESGRLIPDGKPNRPLTAFNVEFLKVQ